MTTTMSSEDAPEEDEETPAPDFATPGKLLDRLLYRGMLPRYAFPTDVATFHVFDRDRSIAFPADHALCAVPGPADRADAIRAGQSRSGFPANATPRARFIQSCPTTVSTAWESKRLYWNAASAALQDLPIGEIEPQREAGLRSVRGRRHVRRGRYWLRPPGFAHPVDAEEVTSPDDMPETSYATRAKLTMETPTEEAEWTPVNRPHPGSEGARASACVEHRAEARRLYLLRQMRPHRSRAAIPTPTARGPHRKPYPGR